MFERETDTHIYFWGSPLSNWYYCEFEYCGHKFYNSEQAFMWEKATFFDDEEIAKTILNTASPRIAKKLGRQIKNFDAEKWSEVSRDIMTKVNKAKWNSSEEMKTTLKSTFPKTLVEASPYDKIWGVGLSANDDRILDEKNWRGKNWLGMSLMLVREYLVLIEK